MVMASLGAMLGATDTRPCYSPSRLSEFHVFFLRENGPETFIRTFPSHPAVTCSESASPEEYKKFRCSGYLLSPSSLRCFPRRGDEMHRFGPSMDTRSCVSLWRWSFHTSLVSDSHLFGAVSPEKCRILNTSGDDFRSCFRILGSTADTRAHASVYGVWGRLHVFPREERDIFIGDTSGGHVIVLLRREGVLGKVVVS